MKRIRTATTLAGMAATALVAALSGCASLTSPATIVTPYPAADGTTLKVPDSTLTLADFLVVGIAQGQPAEVVGSIINDGTTPIKVTLTAQLGATAQPSETRVTVPPNSSTRIGPDQDISMTVPQLPVLPGAEMTLSTQTTATGRSDFKVPVYRPVGYYAGMTPSPTPSATSSHRAGTTRSTPSSSPTTTPTATPTS